MIRVQRSTVIEAPVERVWAVLRDFNSHEDWHPAVAASRIEEHRASDEVGCVRDFRLAEGGTGLREQLLALSDRDRTLTYCILDAPVPLEDYVATIRLKPVTDGDRTFWSWESRFAAPDDRAEELTSPRRRRHLRGRLRGRPRSSHAERTEPSAFRYRRNGASPSRRRA